MTINHYGNDACIFLEPGEDFSPFVNRPGSSSSKFHFMQILEKVIFFKERDFLSSNIYKNTCSHAFTVKLLLLLNGPFVGQPCFPLKMFMYSYTDRCGNFPISELLLLVIYLQGREAAFKVQFFSLPSSGNRMAAGWSFFTD